MAHTPPTILVSVSPDTSDALGRLTTVITTLPDDEVPAYLILCMAILANNAPDVVHFLLDRADERLGR